MISQNFSRTTHLGKEHEDQDDLQGDRDQLQDPVGNVDFARDGVVVGEDAHGDGEAAVDVDKEDAKQEKENVETVVKLAWVDLQPGHLGDGEAGGQDAQAVEDTVEHFPDVLEGHVRLSVQGGVTKEHDKVGNGGGHDEDSSDETNVRVGPVNLRTKVSNLPNTKQEHKHTNQKQEHKQARTQTQSKSTNTKTEHNLLQSAKEVWKPPGSQSQLHFFSEIGLSRFREMEQV